MLEDNSTTPAEMPGGNNPWLHVPPGNAWQVQMLFDGLWCPVPIKYDSEADATFAVDHFCLLLLRTQSAKRLFRVIKVTV